MAKGWKFYPFWNQAEELERTNIQVKLLQESLEDARRQVKAKDSLLEETIQRLAEVNARMDNMLAGMGH